MSDFDENEEVVVTERNYQEEAFKNAINSRIVVSNALKEGTLSCLPNAEGFADTEKVINAVTGKVYCLRAACADPCDDIVMALYKKKPGCLKAVRLKLEEIGHL